MRLNRRGVTLIELLLALALTFIVFGIVAAFFDTSKVFFSEGKAQAEIQHDVRLALEQISTEVRYATSLTLTDGGPDSNGIWYYLEDNRLKRREGATAEDRTRGGLLDEVTFGVNGIPGSYTLTITVTRTDGFSLETEVFLDNLDEASDVTLSGGDSKLQFEAP